MNIKCSETPLLSVADIRILEQALFTQKDSFSVMQTAAQAVYEQIVQDYSNPRIAPMIHCVLGSGNNAGDGLLVAGLLHQAGYRVQAYTVFDKGFHGDAKKAEQFAISRQVAIQSFCLFDCGANDVIVDALFGIGLDRPIGGRAAVAIEHINQCRQQNPNCVIYAIDVPAGIDADSGNRLGVAVTADKTVTFIADKIGLHTADGKGCSGAVSVADLGAKTLPATIFRYDYTEMPLCKTQNTHKGHYGHALMIGGGQGMFGAVALSAISVLKVGAGKSSIFSHADYKSQYHVDTSTLYEVMRCLSLDDLSAYNAIVLGPGLGRDEWGKKTFALVNATMTNKHPLLIDADGLYHLADNPAAFQGGLTLITPHEAEAARLLKTSVAAIRADKLTAVKQLARDYQCVAVLKGAGTLISDGQMVWVNTTGNINLATAGSGDVLAGMIGGYLARGFSPLDAARYGVYQHGLAADKYLHLHLHKSMRASELWDFL